LNNLEITYNGFVNRISEVSKRDIILRLTRRALISLLFFVVLALICLLLEALFRFPSGARRIIFFGYVSSLFAAAATVIFTAYHEVMNLKSDRSLSYYARKIGEYFPEIKDNLLNAIQLYKYTRKKDTYFSKELVSESIQQFEKRSSGFNFADILSYRSNKKYASLFAGSLLLSAILFLALPHVFQASSYRLLNYNYTFIENTLGIAFEVKPGDIEISKGDNVNLWARILFNDPDYKTDNIALNTKVITGDGAIISSNSENLTSSSLNEFAATLSNVNSATIYWFEFKGIKSDEHKISITNRPVIKNVKITVYPPAYTKLPSREVEENEFTTITGSRVYVQLESSDELSQAMVEFAGSSRMPMEVNGKNSVTTFTVSNNGSFSLSIGKDFSGKLVSNVNKPQYNYRVYPDEYPKISILEPDAEFNVQGKEEVTLRSRITDDFGFTKMRLAYKLSKSKYGLTDKDFGFSDITIKNLDATGLEVPHVWNLNGLNLGTEDEVEYYVEVYDNDAVSGPKVTRSEIRKLIYPSLETLLKKTEKAKDEIESSLKSAYEEAMELKQELDEIKQKLERNPEELGLNDPKKNQELQEKIENIQSQFSNTQQKLNELMNELQNANQISKETLDKYMELQKLFQQIDSQELRDALKKLQEAMKNLNPDQLREALKNFKFDEENFKRSLEKTMELLKKILNEQKFGELTKKLDEITKKQDEIKEQTENTDDQDKDKMNELSKSQEQLKKEYEEFQKQLQELVENMKKLPNDGISKELEKLLKEMQKRNLEQKMNESSQNLQKGDKNKSGNQQMKISQSLHDLNEMMQQLLSQMIENENSKLMAKMQEILEKMKKMSEKEGELMESSKELDKNSENSEFKQNAKEQGNLSNELSNTIEDLMSLSQQMPMTPQMGKLLGDAFNEMNKATQSLNNKEGPSANKSQGKAKESLDKAIQKLESMCQSGNKPGMGNSLQQLLQALQQLIERQQGINQQLGQLSPEGKEGKFTQEQMAQMQRLALEQETVRKNLQQLNEEFKKQQEIEGKKLLGNLDEVQKDMMEIIKDLEQNNISPETRKRQEKILSRMLDFQLSVREKDFEKKRESRPGKNFDRTSPPEIIISMPNIINGINQDALEQQRESYSEDYEVLIQKYMEKIRHLNTGQ